MKALLLLALAMVAGPPRPGGGQESPPALDGIGVDERPGARLPLERTFLDEDGSTGPLGRFFAAGDARPVLLVPGYFRCRMLCGVVAPRLLARLDQVEGWTPGEDYRVLLVSIDPREGPEDARRRRARSLGGGGAGWSLLTAAEDGAVEALARAVGFRYRYDPATDQFAHAALVVAVAPDGTIARYVYGVDPAPDTLGAVLAAAREHRSAASLEQILVRCFRFTPALRRYAALVASVLRGGAILILVGLGAVFVLAGRRAATGGADRGGAG